MSEQQVRQLRRFRQVSERRMDVNRLAVEPVTILDINGHRLIAVSEFKYLGTMVTNRGGVAKEVTRRMLLSSSVMASLGKIWTQKFFLYSSSFDYSPQLLHLCCFTIANAGVLPLVIFV